jgi:hypothetical protein
LGGTSPTGGRVPIGRALVEAMMFPPVRGAAVDR